MTALRIAAGVVLAVLGFTALAYSLYRILQTFSVQYVEVPFVVIGTLLVVISPLVLPGGSWGRRAVGALLALLAVAALVLGYPIFGVLGGVPRLDWIWAIAAALYLAAWVIARGRGRLALLVVPLAGLAWMIVGIIQGTGLAGWWPVDIRPGRELQTLLATARGIWPLQVLLTAGFVAIWCWIAAALDLPRRRAVTTQPV